MAGPSRNSAHLGSRRSIIMNSSLLLSLLLSVYPATSRAETAAASPKQPTRATRAKARKPARVLVAQAAPPAAPPAAAPEAPAAAPAEPPAAPPPEAPAEAAPPPAAEAAPADEALPPPPDDLPPPPDVPADVPGEGVYQDKEEDIIRVTVNRRVQDIQDVSGSATVLGQETFEKLGITNLRNITNTTPYVEIGNQEGNTEVFIRGIGSNNNTELGDPAVATHIDGVYIPRPRGIGSMIFDIDRVEVNRGPQGTLYGRNAVGGTLNVVTKAPVLKELGAEATVGFGNYRQRVGQGVVNVPIGDRLALRAAFFSEYHEPFYKNAGPIHTLKGSDSVDNYAYRVSAKWNPIDALTIRITHDFTSEGGTGYSGSNYQDALTSGILPEEVPDPRAVWYRGPQARMDMKHWGISGDIGLDLGPIQIKYLGSYRNSNYKQITAGNAGVDFNGKTVSEQSLDDWGTSYWHQISRSIIQEVRILSADDARFRWAVGGFFFREDQDAFLGSTAEGWYFGGEYTMPDMYAQSFAGFADGTFDITKWLRALAGVRITSEEKNRTGIGFQYNFNNTTGERIRFGTEGFRWNEWSRPDLPYSGPATSGGTNFSPFTNGVANFGIRDTIDEALVNGGVTQGGDFVPQDGERTDKYIDFRVGGELDITPDNMVYAKFTTGHKAGGFNDNLRVPVQVGPDGQAVDLDGDGVGDMRSIAPSYAPEKLYAVEVGSKNEFFGRKLVANASAFWYSYTDQQFQSVVALGPPDEQGRNTGTSAVRRNAGASRVLGLELDARYKLPLGFVADVAALLMNAVYTDLTTTDSRLGWGLNEQLDYRHCPGGVATEGCEGREFDLSGNKMPRSPTLAINYAIGQTIPTSIGYFDWRFSGQTKTKQYMTVFNGEGKDLTGKVEPRLSDVVPGYTRFDANIGYTHIDGRLRLEGFVTNLNDVAFMTSIINTPGLNLRFFNPPRQFGARLTVYL